MSSAQFRSARKPVMFTHNDQHEVVGDAGVATLNTMERIHGRGALPVTASNRPYLCQLLMRRKTD